MSQTCYDALKRTRSQNVFITLLRQIRLWSQLHPTQNSQATVFLAHNSQIWSGVEVCDSTNSTSPSFIGCITIASNISLPTLPTLPTWPSRNSDPNHWTTDKTALFQAIAMATSRENIDRHWNTDWWDWVPSKLWLYPLVNLLQFAIENGPVEIVDSAS